MSTDYKPKKQTEKSPQRWCIFCHHEIEVGESFHYIRSLSAGTRAVCMTCAEKILKISEDDTEEEQGDD